MDCVLGAQDAGACLYRSAHVCQLCQECVRADGYACASVNFITRSSLRLLLFITRLAFVMYCLRVNGTSPRQILTYILMSLSNKLPCVLVQVKFTAQ